MISRKICRAFVVLAFAGLAGCGGSGGGGPSDSRPSSKLFVVDSGNNAIGSMIDPNPTPGTFAVDRILSGPNTGLGTPGTGTPSVSTLPGFALDPVADRMWVATQLSVLSWDNAGLVSGNTRWNRTVTSTINEGAGPRGINFHSLFHDRTNNRLYAAEPRGDVHVYNGAATLSGSVAPNRSIKPDLGTGVESILTFGVAVDLARDLLYVGVVPSDSRIIVYDNQASLTPVLGTPVTPNRTLLIPGGASSFYLDTVNNRLYVAVTGGHIRVYDNASTLNGTDTHNRTFTLGSTQKYIFVDTTANRLYGVSENFVYIIPNVSTADGPLVTGTVLQVQSPGSLFSAVAVKP